MLRSRSHDASTSADGPGRRPRPARGHLPGPPLPGGPGSWSGRLDPVRWRRPGRAGLIRSAAVAVLLVTAAALVYAREPAACLPSGVAGAPAAIGAPRAGIPPAAPAGTSMSAAAEAGRGSRTVPRGSVGVPVRLADPAALGVLRPGDRVDLMATGEDGAAARIAANALVLAVGQADDPGAGLFLALTGDEARRTAGTSGEARLSVLVRPPP